MTTRYVHFAALVLIGVALSSGRTAAEDNNKPAAAPTGKSPSDEAPGAAVEAPSAPSASSEAAKIEKTYAPLEEGLGAVEGRIVLKGEVPAVEPLRIPSNHQDYGHCSQHAKSERLVLSEDKEIRDVVVSVADFKLKGRVAPQTATLDNKNCTFVPHVLAVTRGSTLSITNSDPYNHNTHALLNNEFNDAVIPGLPPRKKKLRQSGWTALQCDLHPWMKGHIHVFDHPLFDVTTAAGYFRIVNIPPGEYEIEVWHEKVAFAFDPSQKKRVGKVKVEAGKTARLDVELESGAK